MVLRDFWIEIAELFLGVGNYTQIQPIADVVFVVFAIALIIIGLLAPFLMVIFLFGKMREVYRGWF